MSSEFDEQREPDQYALSGPTTESRNPATMEIDLLPTIEMLERFNSEDLKVAAAVRCELPQIAQAVDQAAERMRRGGRVFYFGAGTSGRLGALDAAEWPPTFGTPPELAQAFIAGGPAALTQSVEAAEDNYLAGEQAVEAAGIGQNDVVIGLAASGRTPYVIGAVMKAQELGALTVGICCNRPSPLGALADIAIVPVVGPEALTGSTRLKAGTAQKLVLNMFSTGVMVRLGKTYGNLMVDMRATNTKLRERSRRMIEMVTGLEPKAAGQLLECAGGEVKTAILMELGQLDATDARAALEAVGGVIRRALQAQHIPAGSTGER